MLPWKGLPALRGWSRRGEMEVGREERNTMEGSWVADMGKRLVGRGSDLTRRLRRGETGCGLVCEGMLGGEVVIA